MYPATVSGAPSTTPPGFYNVSSATGLALIDSSSSLRLGCWWHADRATNSTTGIIADMTPSLSTAPSSSSAEMFYSQTRAAS